MADVITLDEIEKVRSFVETNNTENAVGNLSQKLTAIWNFIVDRIGKTDDGGGGLLTGSVMAKQNELIRATEVNATAKVDGTLSQQLSWIINNIGYPEDAYGTYNTGQVQAKLSTLLLNNEYTSFVAGDSIVKYKPISSSTLFGSDSYGDYAEYKVYTNGSYYDDTYDICMPKNTVNQYYFIANRSGAVRLTVTGYVKEPRSSYNLNVFVTLGKCEYAKSNYIGSTSSIYADKKTVTFDFGVSEGSEYYINFDMSNYCEFTIDELKVTYDIVHKGLL